MESFLPSEIARLVLGYLEEIKCPVAYETFLKTCSYLDECLKMKQEGRRFRTQVLGLSLLEILYEYSAIYSLVQERLKKVEPETAESLRNSGSLLDKITFLLNATSSGQTMLFSITLPPGKSPQSSTVAHVRKRFKNSPSTERRKESRKASHHPTAEVHSYPEDFEIRAGSSVIEATCLSNLPGNNVDINERILDCYHQAEDDISKTPKRKATHMKKCRSNSISSEGVDENLDLSIITKALLDNHELHEKIAENINKVICTPEINAGTGDHTVLDLACQHNFGPSESSTSFCVSNNFSMELDNAIKKIVQETESDPVFEHLLQDVVGPVAEETSDDCDDRGISDTSTPYQSTPEINKKQSLRNRLRSSKPKRTETSLTSPSELNIPNKIDNQNAAAIESIVLMNTHLEHEKSSDCNISVSETKLKDTVLPENENVPQANVNVDMVVSSTEIQNTMTVTAPVTKVSTVDSVMQPIAVAATPSIVTSSAESITNKVPSPKKLLPIGNVNQSLVMVSQQNTIPSQSAIVITETYCQQPLIQDNKIIFLSNKVSGITSQFVTVQPSQFHQFAQPTVISDSDIINMPTVFMCGDEMQQSYVPTTGTTNVCAGNSVNIVPKGPLPEISNEPYTAKDIAKPKLRAKKKKTVTSSTSTCETETVKFVISVQAEAKSRVETKLTDQTVSESSSSSAAASVSDVVAPSVPIINLHSCNKEEPVEAPKSVTPSKTSDNKVQTNLSTPRHSRSHVRALDFSTPPNDDGSGRKAIPSPKTRSSKSKSPKAVTKNVRANLFTAPIEIVNIPIATRSPMAKLTGDWDQVQGAGTILGGQKISQKTRNSFSDSDIVVQSKTKVTLPAKLDRPRRTASLKSKRIEPAEKAKPNTDETEKGSANDSKESVEKHPEDSEDKTGEEKELTAMKNSKKYSWDEDLRALVQSIHVVSNKKVAAIKKKSPKRIAKAPRKKSKKKDANKSAEMNKTDEDGLSIEKELEKMDPVGSENKVEEESENNNDSSKSKTKTGAVIPKKRRQSKKAKGTAQKEKETKEVTLPEVEVQNEKGVKTQEVEARKDEASAVDEIESAGDSQEQGKEAIADNLRNMKPRYNKKCNVGSAVKKNSDSSEEFKGMTIMSPSKMNANKRTLVEPECKKEKETTLTIFEVDSLIASVPSTSIASCDIVDISANQMAQDLYRPSTSNFGATVRTPTPVLETPVKGDSLLLPITPRIFLTPFSTTDSPFSKIFSKDETGSVNLSSIPTPSFPVTPKFTMTPDSQAGDSGSYTSRPTDYSNCNSYYQPSDSDQNQRLEQVLIQEAIKQEHYVNSGTVTSTPAKHSPSLQKLETKTKNVSYILQEPVLPTGSKVETVVRPDERVVVTPQIQIEPVVEVDMKLSSTETQTCEEMSNSSVIEPANTTQRSIDTSQGSSGSNSSSSSSSDSSSSECDSSNDEEEKDGCTNDTVIHVPVRAEVKAQPTPERYTLRSSTKQNSVVRKAIENDSSSDSIIYCMPKRRVRRISDSPTLMKSGDETGGTSKACKSNVTRSHQCLLKELDVKRKRTINIFKTDDEKPSEKPKKVRKKSVKKQQLSKDNVPVTKPRKGRPRKNPVTKYQVPQKDIKPVRRKETTLAVVKKIITPRKSETIESVAARLMEKNKPELDKHQYLEESAPVRRSFEIVKQEGNISVSPSNASIDSEIGQADKEKQHLYASNLEEEDFPRLHISSDEDDPKSPDLLVSYPCEITAQEDPQVLVTILQEKVIHLISNKVIDTAEIKGETTPDEEKTAAIVANELKSAVNIDEEMCEETSDVSTMLSKHKSDIEKCDKVVSKDKKIKIKSDVILNKTDKIYLSKIERSQSIFTDTILGQTAKLNINMKKNDEKKESSPVSLPSVQEPLTKMSEITKEVDTGKLNNSSYNSPTGTTISDEFLIDEEFHVKIITEDSPEYITVVHDESKKCDKKLSDYNLGLLTKTISAKVYIEELNIDQDRQMVISPYIELLSISPPRKRRNTKKPNEDATASKTLKKSMKPLDILYNELVDEQSSENKENPNTETKLENQDESEVEVIVLKTAEDTLSNMEQGTNSCSTEIRSTSKSKVTDQKSEEISQPVEQQSTGSKDNQQKKKTTITLEQYKSKTSKKKTVETCESGAEIANKTSIEKNDEKITEENEEDSLMTFAVIGNEKNATVETPAQDSKLKKRKATSIIDSSKQSNEKRIKPNDKQKLLAIMDLDSFLTELHGPSSQ